MTALLLHVGRGVRTVSPRPMCGPAGPSVPARHLPVTCGQITDQSPYQWHADIVAWGLTVILFVLFCGENLSRHHSSSITQQMQNYTNGLKLKPKKCFISIIVNIEVWLFCVSVNSPVRNWVCVKWHRFAVALSDLVPQNLTRPETITVNFYACRVFLHLELRQWPLWAAGVVAAQFSAIKRKQNVSRSKAWGGFFTPLAGAAGGFSLDGTAADLACFTARGPTWRGVKLYFQTPTAFPPTLPGNLTRLFTCCLAGFMALGLGYLLLLKSAALPAKHFGTAHSARETNATHFLSPYNAEMAFFWVCVCVCLNE